MNPKKIQITDLQLRSTHFNELLAIPMGGEQVSRGIYVNGTINNVPACYVGLHVINCNSMFIHGITDVERTAELLELTNLCKAYSEFDWNGFHCVKLYRNWAVTILKLSSHESEGIWVHTHYGVTEEAIMKNGFDGILDSEEEICCDESYIDASISISCYALHTFDSLSDIICCNITNGAIGNEYKSHIMCCNSVANNEYVGSPADTTVRKEIEIDLKLVYSNGNSFVLYGTGGYSVRSEYQSVITSCKSPMAFMVFPKK